jgi:hypothetical protein
VDIVEKINRKKRQARIHSPLDFLFSESADPEDEQAPDEAPDEEEESPDLLNLHQVGEMSMEALGTPTQKEVIELNTESPDKIRYLKLIVALLESSNYDAAISAVAELSEQSRDRQSE